MNPWQTLQQLKHLLSTAVWPGGASTDVVFGTRGVRAFAGTPTEEQIPASFPWCLIAIGSATADEFHPELLMQQFTLISAVNVAGDAMGEHAVIGGPAASLVKGAGRGIGEVLSVVSATVGNLTAADGARLVVSQSSIDSPAALGRGRHLAVGEQTVTALCTSALHYTAPQEIAYDTGSETWTWEGTHCSDRFDFLQYRLVSKSGSSPPSSPSDGTTIYTGTAATTESQTASDTTYCVFADYNARGGSTVEGSSSPVVGSYLVVE